MDTLYIWRRVEQARMGSGGALEDGVIKENRELGAEN
jgi:hypothetical protein